MSGNDITTEAVRLAMSMNQLRAEYASQNISRSNTPDAKAVHLDFAHSQSLLEQVVSQKGVNEGSLLDAIASAATSPTTSERTDAAINLDEEVADMASANLKYQALTESLNRHFGLMRLAITGRN
ncbi:MAG: flagellar basal body rod protein FlgB [Arenimonas sp.]